MGFSIPKISTAEEVKPQCYGYTTPGVTYNEGMTKIGYTEHDVDRRIWEQTHTAHIKAKKEWDGEARFDDDKSPFMDHDFHAYLTKEGIRRQEDEDNEWFYIDGPTSKAKFDEFKQNHGIIQHLDTVVDYKLRDEQDNAVGLTLDYWQNHPKGKFLWNAKPRFGKTLSTYDFIKRAEFKNVVIVTNRPAVSNSWFDDYAKFLGPQNGYVFVSDDDNVKKIKGVTSVKEWPNAIRQIGPDKVKQIRFVSLQDLKGSKFFGGSIDKLKDLVRKDDDKAWDLLVIDESHEGVDTYKTDLAFEHLHRKFTLHLSGTPFKALNRGDFDDNAVFNWTYADEQEAKRKCEEAADGHNPYENLPKLTLYSYQMSDMVLEEAQRGVQENDESYDFLFDLNEFFKVENGRFVYDSSVDKFLIALTTQNKYPFSTSELRDELKHTFWLLYRVESAKCLAKKLKDKNKPFYEVFKDYEIVLAAGDGKLDDADATEKSYKKVKNAIQKFDRTITLSVGQLTTGVTVEQWSAVLMLCNMTSESLYMQAAFRAQNPCLYTDNGSCKRKQNAYIFDFDPARTLIIYDKFANNLNNNKESRTSEGRQRNISRLLNFFPVIGEDSNGQLEELDAEKILSIPVKLKCTEVVSRGFMCNYLFKNISNIFSAPAVVKEICDKMQATKEGKRHVSDNYPDSDDLHLDKDGNVDLTDKVVIGKQGDLFGDAQYETQEAIEYACESIDDAAKSALDNLTKSISENLVDKIVDDGAQALSNVDDYDRHDFTTKTQKALKKYLREDAQRQVKRVFDNYKIDKANIEADAEKLKKDTSNDVSQTEIDQQTKAKLDELVADLPNKIKETVDSVADNAQKAVVKAHEQNKAERKKKSVEDEVRAHLRGFTRTIPSFLMAYGSRDTKLATFEQDIPDDVFLEVTSITKDEFRFLRDGGDYTNEEGEPAHFEGELFDETVFDSSCEEFFNKKDELSDYFDLSTEEDIFDYIPPQRTNQIFTPKKVVKQMVDLLEEENPGCFDDSSKTFIDLYMKSGLYIAEIVTRLFNSEAIAAEFPNKKERLQHIFKYQVYGCAPTEIIYKIAKTFILGFAADASEFENNLRLYDALPSAKSGTLEQDLNAVFTPR